jgi:preprotein translocase subunit SecG
MASSGADVSEWSRCELMVVVVAVIHVVASLLMCILVLMHSGQGGGLSDFMGGGSMAAGSTVMEKNLDRITVVAAIVFSFTTILLGLLLIK